MLAGTMTFSAVHGSGESDFADKIRYRGRYANGLRTIGALALGYSVCFLTYGNYALCNN